MIEIDITEPDDLLIKEKATCLEFIFAFSNFVYSFGGLAFAILSIFLLQKPHKMLGVDDQARLLVKVGLIW